MRRVLRTVIGSCILGVMLAAPAMAGLSTKIYQDAFGPGSSRVWWQYVFNYPSQETTPETGQCKGALAQAANFIGPGYTSPAAPFAGLHWAFSNTRQGATDYAPIGFACVKPLPMGCPGCNQIDHTPKLGYNGTNAFDSYNGTMSVVTDGAGAVTVTPDVRVTGATSPGLQASALSDTAFARDSVAIKIRKHVVGTDSTVTLQNFGGEIRNNPGLGNATITSSYFVAVYADSNAANADDRASGDGSLFYARVVLTSTGVSVAGGFAKSDFQTIRNADGSLSARPVPGFTRSVVVPQLKRAVVTVVADPWSNPPTPPTGVPGLPPIAGLILALLLLTGGLWFVQQRQAKA